jgi:threonine 3-dehydrogenase
VVITDVNPYRLELARTMGVTLAIDVRTTSIADAQTQLGMKEVFDVGLEMSGNPDALRDMLANLSHGAKAAMLGLPEQPFAIDWSTVIFEQLTLRGVYGRQMYETWYMMTSMLQSGLDITPVITHRFPAERFEDAFAEVRTGNTGKVLLDWSDDA